MQPRIDAMRTRLETSRRLNAQHLEALERAKATIGTEHPTREQLMDAYTAALRELADGGDDLARRRIELADEASRRLGDAAYQQNLRLLSSASRGGAELARKRIEARHARSRQVAGRGGPGHGRAPMLPDPERLERYATRLRRASADIGYLARQPLGTREGTVLVWAGMRGAVTVAAAQTLPPGTPHRALLVFVAFTVATLSLLVQGGTIGLIVRRLFSTEPSQEETQHLAEQHAAILALLDTAASEAELAVDDDLSDKERQLATLVAQRDTLLDARDDGLFDADALQHALDAVDAQEIALSMQGGPEGGPPLTRSAPRGSRRRAGCRGPARGRRRGSGGAPARP